MFHLTRLPWRKTFCIHPSKGLAKDIVYLPLINIFLLFLINFLNHDSIQRDIERNGPPHIPENFSILQGVRTTKTSVRKPSDYPVLHERFKDM